jgi:zinc protease
MYYERLPIGKKEILEKCPQAALKRFYSDWYRPDLMAIVAVGDFDPEQMRKRITDSFSGIPSRQNPRKLQVYNVPDNENIIIATATDREARYAEVEIIYKQPKESNVSVLDYRRGIAQQLFSSMLNSRLSELERLSDPPYINGSGGYGRLVRNCNAYSLSAICREDGIQKAFNTLLEENERIRRFGFSLSELERQKKELMRGMEMANAEREKTESRNFAREYVSNYLTGEPFPGIEYEYELYKKHLGGITLEEINSFAGKWITSGKNCIVLITAPEKESTVMLSEEYIKEKTVSIKTQSISMYVDKVSTKPLVPVIPPAKKISSEKSIKEFDITEINLENGVKVFFKQTDFKNDEIIFSSYSWGGWSVIPKEDFLSASIADAIVDESGVGEIDAISLEKMLSGKVVSCSPYISELQHGFRGSCSPGDLETLFQLIYSYSMNPRKDTVAFRSVIERRRGVLKNRSSDPQSVFGDSVRYAMAWYSYYYRPWTTQMLDSINLDKSLTSYKRLFSESGSSVYVFVGNFNRDSLKHLASIYLGNLSAGSSNTTWKNIGLKNPSGYFERTLKLGQEPKSTVNLRWNMTFEYNRNNRNEVNALNKLVSIRLRETLREEKSGVYGVGFNSSPYHYPEQKLEQVVSFSCSPGNVTMLIQSVQDVLAEVREKGSNEMNLVKIKETAIRERETFMKENTFWLSTISSNHQNRENILEIMKYNDWVNGLNTTDFIGFAKKYLVAENYSKFVLMPAEK